VSRKPYSSSWLAKLKSGKGAGRKSGSPGRGFINLASSNLFSNLEPFIISSKCF